MTDTDATRQMVRVLAWIADTPIGDDVVIDERGVWPRVAIDRRKIRAARAALASRGEPAGEISEPVSGPQSSGAARHVLPLHGDEQSTAAPLAAPDDWATVEASLDWVPTPGSADLNQWVDEQQKVDEAAKAALARLRADSHAKTEALRGEWKGSWMCDRGHFNPYPAAVCQWCGIAAAAAAPKETR